MYSRGPHSLLQVPCQDGQTYRLMNQNDIIRIPVSLLAKAPYPTRDLPQKEPVSVEQLSKGQEIDTHQGSPPTPPPSLIHMKSFVKQGAPWK